MNFWQINDPRKLHTTESIHLRQFLSFQHAATGKVLLVNLRRIYLGGLGQSSHTVIVNWALCIYMVHCFYSLFGMERKTGLKDNLIVTNRFLVAIGLHCKWTCLSQFSPSAGLTGSSSQPRAKQVLMHRLLHFVEHCPRSSHFLQAS